MKRYRLTCYITIGLVYLLIFVGGIVRSTGAGMGCPDWPKCFDKWVPPLAESELPDDYADRLHERRIHKTNKLKKLLNILNVNVSDEETAAVIDQNVFYNAEKAWIEYGNRVVGVLIGFSIFLTSVFAFLDARSNKPVLFLSLGAFLLVMIEGYLGSLVVATNLIPGLISIHMLLALLIVMMLVTAGYLVREKRSSTEIYNVTEGVLYGVLLFMTFVQLFMGINVREEVDTLFKSGISREIMGSELLDINVFLIHRSFSWLLLVGAAYLTWRSKFKKTTLFVLGFFVMEALAGIVLGNLGFKSWAQPIHLTLACLLIGAQYLIVLKSRSNKEYVS